MGIQTFVGILAGFNELSTAIVLEIREMEKIK